MKKLILKVLIATALASGGALAAQRVAVEQAGCSAQEQQLIMSYVEQIAQAAFAGDMQGSMMLGQELQNSLSPACTAVLAQSQAYAPGPGYPGGYPQSAPSVYDHGGGTYSVPGLGACGPGGCIS
jgi:hypothetical protein